MRISSDMVTAIVVASPTPTISALGMVPFNANYARFYGGNYGFVNDIYFYGRLGSVV